MSNSAEIGSKSKSKNKSNVENNGTGSAGSFGSRSVGRSGAVIPHTDGNTGDGRTLTIRLTEEDVENVKTFYETVSTAYKVASTLYNAVLIAKKSDVEQVDAEIVDQGDGCCANNGDADAGYDGVIGDEIGERVGCCYAIDGNDNDDISDAGHDGVIGDEIDERVGCCYAIDGNANDDSSDGESDVEITGKKSGGRVSGESSNKVISKIYNKKSDDSSDDSSEGESEGGSFSF
jgi:hypothetical protein